MPSVRNYFDNSNSGKRALADDLCRLDRRRPVVWRARLSLNVRLSTVRVAPKLCAAISVSTGGQTRLVRPTRTFSTALQQEPTVRPLGTEFPWGSARAHARESGWLSGSAFLQVLLLVRAGSMTADRRTPRARSAGQYGSGSRSDQVAMTRPAHTRFRVRSRLGTGLLRRPCRWAILRSGRQSYCRRTQQSPNSNPTMAFRFPALSRSPRRGTSRIDTRAPVVC